MAIDLLTDAQRAALWRRHFEVYDDLVYGYLDGARCQRCAARERRWWRRAWRWLRAHPRVTVRGISVPVYALLRWHYWHAIRVCVPRYVRWLEAQELRKRRRDRDKTMSLDRLRSARHELSVPRLYPQPPAHRFYGSDPLDEGYVGIPEASFLRTRREVDNEWA